MVITMSTLCKGSFTKSLILMDSFDVVITSTMGCEGSITKITPESLTLMDTTNVSITITTGCEGSVTKITVESLTMMWLERPRRDLKVVSQKSQLNLSP